MYTRPPAAATAAAAATGAPAGCYSIQLQPPGGWSSGAGRTPEAVARLAGRAEVSKDNRSSAESAGEAGARVMSEAQRGKTQEAKHNKVSHVIADGYPIGRAADSQWPHAALASRGHGGGAAGDSDV